MLNWIWLGLILGAVLLGGFTDKLPDVATAAFDSSKKAVMDIALPMAGIMALWLGIMRLAEKSGLVEILARGLRPILRWLFPEVPANHPAMGSMVMNMAANMLGLSNAATPLGLRAMQDLEKLNPRPGVATNAMCTFLAINTSSIQLIPATAVAILATAGSKDPFAIIGTAFMATVLSTLAAVIVVKALEKLPAYALPAPAPEDQRRVEEALRQEALDSVEETKPMPVWGRAILVAFAVVMLYLGYHSYVTLFQAAGNKPVAVVVIEVISLLAIPFILTFFPLFAALKGIPVYEEFVEGAKEGMQVALRIIPFLVAILAAVGMFRASGGIAMLTGWLSPLLSKIFFPPELLPLVLVRPLSGGGATGIFAELAQTFGGDSLIARMGGTIMGSTETTFYVIAVYFGSVMIRRTRHAVPAGLVADLVGIIAAVAICNLVFGSR